MTWRAIDDAPRDGTPIWVLHSDGSGVFMVAYITVKGRTGWWEIEADEDEPYQTPYADDSDDDWCAGWVPFPADLLANGRKFLKSQYGKVAR